MSAKHCSWCGNRMTGSVPHDACARERAAYAESRQGVPERGELRNLQQLFSASTALALEDYRTLEAMGSIRGTSVPYTVEHGTKWNRWNGHESAERHFPVFGVPEDGKRDYEHVRRAYRTVPDIKDLVIFWTRGYADRVLDIVGVDMRAEEVMRRAGIGQTQEGEE